MALTTSGRRRVALRRSLLFASLAWLVVTVVHLSGILDGLDLKTLDWRFRLRGERAPSDSIALVCLDDVTIRGYGTWPIPRDAYALLLAALGEGGARAVGIDLQLPDDPRQDPKWNRLLAQVSESHVGTVHSIWFQSERAAGASPPRAELAEALAQRGITAGDIEAARATAVSLPFDDLVTGAAAMGHISVAVDPDGSVRRLPLLIRYRDRLYPSLALRLAGMARGDARIRSVRPERGGLSVRWDTGASTHIPVDRAGTTALDFAGEHGSFPFRYSMLDVLQWYRDGELDRLRDAFSGRVVIVGLTAQQEVAEDMAPTPFSAATPLMLVHANALENILRNRFLVRLPAAPYLAALALMALSLGLVFSRLSIPMSITVVTFVTTAFAALDVTLLAFLGLDVPPLPGLILPALVYAATESDRHLSLERYSRHREAEIREGFTVQQRFLPEALIGTQLSRYVIEERLGSGGMSSVYRARDTQQGQDVAIKVLLGGVLADETQRRRFRREARIQSRFRHPGAAAFYEFDSQDGIDFLVMEYIPGESLAARLEKGPLPEKEAVRIALEVTAVLVEAHAHGIIHRDIKPANIILSPNGETKVVDFGVAQLGDSETSTTLTERLTVTGELVGTPVYLAPEVVMGGKAVPGTDLYGVGILLFEMTTGRRPFSDDVPGEVMHMIAYQPPPRPRVLRARLSEQLEAIILRLLEKRPEDRFAGAGELVEALKSIGR